jgi:hypothetical protein
VIPESVYPALRAAATRYVTSAKDKPDYDALAILAHVGPPSELTDRLWRMACDPAEASYFRNVAGRALARIPADDAGLNAAVLAEIEAAFAAPDLPRFARAVAVGFGRGLPAAAELTERVLVDHGPARPDDHRVVAALADCVECLATAGRLSDGFWHEALGQPGTYLRAVAARLSIRRKLPESEVAALQAALAGDDPTCAAEAACVLLGQGIIDIQHAELPAIAARAPLVLRAELIFKMQGRGSSLRDLWSLLEPCLVSPDPAVTEPLRYLSHHFDKNGLQEDLRKILPQVVDPELRLDIEDIFAREGESYWKDEDEGDA